MTAREEEIQNAILSVIAQNLCPQKVYLYGSRGKGTAASSADFDLAIEGADRNEDLRRSVIEKIEAERGLYKVDIVYLEEVEEDFKNIILKTGKLLYERRA